MPEWPELVTVLPEPEISAEADAIADRTGDDSFCRSEVFYVHVSGSPFVLTATTRGMPPGGRSSTVTEAGLVPIRWN